jgi:hypothetical protein
VKIKSITPNGDGTYAITTTGGYCIPRVSLGSAEPTVEFGSTVTEFAVESDGFWTMVRAPMVDSTPDRARFVARALDLSRRPSGTDLGVPSRNVDPERDANGWVTHLG